MLTKYIYTFRHGIPTVYSQTGYKDLTSSSNFFLHYTTCIFFNVGIFAPLICNSYISINSNINTYTITS